MEMNDEMRLPEEGPPTGAGPGTGVNMSGQRLGSSEQPSRGNPEEEGLTTYNTRQRAEFTIDPPTNSASQAHGIGTTIVGLPRRRIKWTPEMNTSVIRAFFKATRNQTMSSNYRQHMYETFIQDYPNLHHLTQQNLADRRAAIVRNNLLPPSIVEEIRQSVINEEPEPNTSTNSYDRDAADPPTVQGDTGNAEGGDSSIEPPAEQENTAFIQNPPSGHEDNAILNTTAYLFQSAKIKFSEIDAGRRPYLPKIKPNGEIFKTIKALNENILPQEILTIDNNFNKLIDILYCSAHTILEAERIRKADVNSNRITGRRPNRYRSSIQNPEVNIVTHQDNRGDVSNSRRRNSRPKWQARVLKMIETTRKDLGFVLSVKSNGLNKRNECKMIRLKRRHLIHTQFDPPNTTIDQVLDTIRQKLAKYTDRYRKYTKSYKRRNDNNIFRNNERHLLPQHLKST